MLLKLKEMYKDQLIEDVKDLNQDYYYFYQDERKNNLFAISKSISKNEYELLKKLYIEKKVYTSSQQEQKIYEYLLENKPFPFKEKQLKMIIYNLKKSDEEVVYDILKQVYDKCYYLKLFDFNLCFFSDDKIKVQELFTTLSDDLGYDINLHDGLIINNGYQGKLIYSYIKAFTSNNKINNRSYTDLADMILEMDLSTNKEVLEGLKINLFDKLFQDVTIRDIINVMIKNDLNVSQSAKLLYMNRNSLINKLDTIYKQTNLNLQKFTHAAIIYMMMNYR